MISDLVWSDPNDHLFGFGANHRGSGVLFGSNAVKSFLANVGLKLLVRAHQAVVDGFMTFADGRGVTLFSSSLYCRLIRNKCGVMHVSAHGKIDLYSMLQEQEWTSSVPKMIINIEREVVIKRGYAPLIPESSPPRAIQNPMASPSRTRVLPYGGGKPPVLWPKRPVGSPRVGARQTRPSPPLSPIPFHMGGFAE
jgi:hypothetical protein